MKTSEFIRAAVDTYLQPAFFISLCTVFDNYADSAWPCYTFDSLAVNELIRREATDAAGFLPVTPHRIDERCIAHNNGRCVAGQAERFMYAEFLALYFEDMGD